MYITLNFSLNFIIFYYILLFYILFYNHDILAFFPRVVSRPAFQGFSASGDAVPWKLWPSADLPSTLHLVLAQHLRKGWRLWLLPSSTRALIETPWSIILFQKVDFQKACCAAYDFFWTVHFVFFNVIFHFSLLLQVLRNRKHHPSTSSNESSWSLSLQWRSWRCCCHTFTSKWKHTNWWLSGRPSTIYHDLYGFVHGNYPKCGEHFWRGMKRIGVTCEYIQSFAQIISVLVKNTVRKDSKGYFMLRIFDSWSTTRITSPEKLEDRFDPQDPLQEMRRKQVGLCRSSSLWVEIFHHSYRGPKSQHFFFDNLDYTMFVHFSPAPPSSCGVTCQRFLVVPCAVPFVVCRRLFFQVLARCFSLSPAKFPSVLGLSTVHFGVPGGCAGCWSAWACPAWWAWRVARSGAVSPSFCAMSWRS